MKYKVERLVSGRFEVLKYVNTVEEAEEVIEYLKSVRNIHNAFYTENKQ